MLISLLLALAHAATTFPTPVKLSTADGVTLSAAWGAPTKATRGVVLVHMSGRSKEDWQSLADKLYRGGIQVLSVDLRGHGANVPPAAAGATPPAPDYPAMLADVKAAVAFLRGKGVTHITLVGAELGANLAINVAADDPAVVDVVMLSPGVDVRGVIASDAVRRYGDRPLLIVASEDDSYSARSSAVLAGGATGTHEFILLAKAGKGTTMLNRDPTLESRILGWVQTHWTPPAPPSAVTAPDDAIKVESETIQTTGPSSPGGQ